jgi:transposase-like protein
MPNSLSFKSRQVKKEIILMLVRWYLAYSLSYRDIEELGIERGLRVDHSTINRWVIYYSPQLEESFRKNYKRTYNASYRMDETYIKIKGKDLIFIVLLTNLEKQLILNYQKNVIKKRLLHFFKNV